MNIREFQSDFQPILAQAVADKLVTYSEYTDDSGILAMIQHVENLIGGGKCIRPYIAYLTYRGLDGEESEEIMQLLVAIEIFHAFALIHDDVIDRGLSRYNVPTLHTFITDDLRENKRWSKDFIHDGNSQAILIGDLLFAWSLARFQQYSHFEYHEEAWQIFIKMIDEVALGQMIDVDMMTRDEVSTRLIETKMKLKTAGYTFVRPMQIGAALAGRYQVTQDFCSEFGIALGLAFQTQDDILDLVADPHVIKKTVLSDLRDHQHTYLTQYVFENGSEADISQLKSIWGKDIDTQDQELIIDIFERTGALDYAESMVQTYLARARQLVLSDTHLTEMGRESLEELITYIENRTH